MFLEGAQLAKFLVDANVLTNAEANNLLQQASASGVSLSNIILSQAKMTEVDLRKAEAHVLGIPYVNLEDEKIDSSFLLLITEAVARSHNVVAYKKSGDGLEVAMLDVDDLPVLDVIKKKLGVKILPRLSDSESIKNALGQYKKSLQAEFKDIIEKEALAFNMVDSGEIDLSE